jgi:hypothetical protein
MTAVDVRRLAAIDMYGTTGTVRRRRIILAEFIAGTVGLVTVGAWLAGASAGLGGRVLGVWMAALWPPGWTRRSPRSAPWQAMAIATSQPHRTAGRCALNRQPAYLTDLRGFRPLPAWTSPACVWLTELAMRAAALSWSSSACSRRVSS